MADQLSTAKKIANQSPLRTVSTAVVAAIRIIRQQIVCCTITVEQTTVPRV